MLQSIDYCPRRNYYWLNSGKGGSSNFKDFFTEIIIAFRPIPVIFPARGAKHEKYWNRQLIPDRAHPAIKSVIFQKLIPGNIFPDPL